MEYLYKKGSNNNLYVLFHHTGGDEKSLLNLVNEIDDKAFVISLRGNIMEGSKRRFFKRTTFNKLDKQSIDEQRVIVTNLINNIILNKKLDNKRLIFLGYSNGANMITSLLYENSIEVDDAIILHGISPYEVIEDKKINTNIFLSYGFSDIFVTYKSFDKMYQYFKRNALTTYLYKNDKGHSISKEEIEEIKIWLENKK